MSELILNQQAATPATPAAGKLGVYSDNASPPNLKWVAPDGSTHTAANFATYKPILHNSLITPVTANAVDTYLSDSAVTMPTGGIQTRTMARWIMVMTKTAAGVATPIWNIRFGLNGSTADTARLTFTMGAQTAAIDTGWVDIILTFEAVGASGNFQAAINATHNLATTGLQTTQQAVQQGQSSNFDTTVANSILGLSVNPGASGVWTFQLVQTDVYNLNI